MEALIQTNETVVETTKVQTPKTVKTPKVEKPKAEKPVKTKKPEVAKIEKPIKTAKVKIVRNPRKNTEAGLDLVKAYYYQIGEEVQVFPAKNSKLPQKQFTGIVKKRFEYFKNAVKCYYIEIDVDGQKHTIVKRQSSITDLNPKNFKLMDTNWVKKHGIITFSEWIKKQIKDKVIQNAE
jgi:hypothetical protein